MHSLDLQGGVFQSLSLFRGFDLNSIGQFAEGSTIVQTRNQEKVFLEGDSADHFWLVIKGVYKLTKESPQGLTTLMSYIVTGEPIGILLMSHPRPQYPVTCTSVGWGKLLKIPRTTYNSAWIQNPEILKRISLIVHQRVLGIHGDRALQRASLEVKVAGFLLKILDLFAIDETSIIQVPIKRQDIADAVGATTESVIRVMSRWEKKGWLKTDHQILEIFKPEELTRVFRGEPEDEFQA